MKEDLLHQILRKLAEMEKNMNERFSEIDHHFDVLTKHVAGNSEQLTVHSGILEEHSGKFDSITKQLEEHSDQLKTLTKDTNSMKVDIFDIKTDVKRIDWTANDGISRLKMIERKMESKDSDTVVLNNRLFKLESTVQKLVNQ